MHSDLLKSNVEIEKLQVEDTEKDTNNVFDDQIEVFASEDEMKKSLTHLCYGDLYVIGRIWIETLKTMMLGAKFTLIPVVSAAKKPEVPQKPPPMKYTDLPLYQSPHYEYKDYLEDKEKCPKAKVKILHTYLLPTVKDYRKDFQKSACEVKCGVINAYYEVRTSFSDTFRDLKKYMRDPNNLTTRQGVAGAGGVAGYFLASGRGIPSRLFFTGLGLLSTGALCFPKETDKAFREFAYHSGKFALAMYNEMFTRNAALRERLPCKEDVPPTPLPRKPQCPPKKK